MHHNTEGEDICGYLVFSDQIRHICGISDMTGDDGLNQALLLQAAQTLAVLLVEVAGADPVHDRNAFRMSRPGIPVSNSLIERIVSFIFT